MILMWIAQITPTPPLCLQVAKIAAYAYSAISQIKVDAKEELVVQFAIPWFDSSATNVTPPILLPSLCHCCLLTLLHPGPFSYASKDRQHCKMAQYDRPLLLFNMGNGRRCNVDGAMFSAHICTHKAANCLSCVDLRKSQNRLWMGKKKKKSLLIICRIVLMFLKDCLCVFLLSSLACTEKGDANFTPLTVIYKSWNNALYLHPGQSCGGC